MRIAGESGCLSGKDIIRNVRVHECDAGVMQSHIDELTLARTLTFDHGHQNADRGKEARADVDQWNAHSSAAAVPASIVRSGWYAVDREHAAHCLK